jgi:hypothetical protein
VVVGVVAKVVVGVVTKVVAKVTVKVMVESRTGRKKKISERNEAKTQKSAS